MNDQPQSNADLQKELQKLRQDYDTIKAAYEKDIAKGKQVEEKLLFINKAFESSSDAIGISNAQGQHIYQNQALSDLFGYTTAEELQAAGGGAIVVYDPEVAKEMYGNIRNGKSWSGELQMITKTGRVFPAYERADAIKDPDGNIIGLIGIITDITEQRKVASKLSESEYEMRLLCNNSTDGIMFTEPSGNIISANPAACRLFGRSEAEICEIGRNGVMDINDPRLPIALEVRSRTGIFNGELNCVRKDGTIFPCEITSAIFKDSSDNTRSSIFIRDISERKQANEALQQSQILLKSSIESQKDTILFSIDSNYQYLYFNKAHSDAMKYAYNQDVEIGMNILDCITSDEDRIVAKENYDRALAGESHSNVRVFGDVNLAYYESFFNPVLNEHDEIIGATGLARNITDRKSAEQALRVSEERLKKAQDVAHIGSWEYDIINNIFWGSDEGKRIYGFDVASDVFTAEEVMKCVVESDRVNQSMIDLIEKNNPYNIVFDIIPRNSDSKRTINSIAELVSDDQGNPAKVIGVLLDITDNKLAEEALIVSETRYRRLFETAKDGILILDAETGMIVDVNPFLIEMLGYSKEQFIEKAIWEIGLFKDIVANKDNFLELQQKEYIRYADMPLETAYGRKINVEFISNVYQVNSHKVIQCNIRDTTDRTMTENRIRLSSQILNLLNTTTPFNETMDLIISHIQDAFGFDAVGVRVTNGDDYPYFSQNGFDADFLKTENTLIERTKEGGICTDKNGKPCLECTCGLVITGKIDTTNPLFTEGGSFYTNDSPVLLGLTADQEPRHNPRNRCIHDGYQSVAIIPIRHNTVIVGLLQLNDRKKDCFTPITIKFFEGIGEMIGVALIRKQVEDAIKLSELEFRLLAESMPQIVWICSPDGKNIYFNNQWVEYTGLSLEESYGHGWNKPFHPDDQQRAWIAWQNATQHGATYALECRLRAADGEYKWWLIRGVPVHDLNGTLIKWFGTCTDIDELKQKEKELLYTKAILQGAMDQSQAGIAIADAPDGKLRYVNNAGLLIRGGNRQDVIDSVGIDQYVASWKILDLDGTPLKPDEVPLARAIMFGETNSREFIIHREVDDDRVVLAKAAPIRDENGSVVSAIVVFLDITEIKHAENEIHTLNETLEKRIAERTQQLEIINKELIFHLSELEQFSYVSNHDLQEPLRTLIQFTQLIKDKYAGKLDEEGNKYIDFIAKAAYRMKELVKDLLEYSLLGKESAITTIDCNNIIEAVLIDLDDSIKKSNARIIVQELPTIKGYETELRLLFQNLIANAIKYQKIENIPEINISAEKHNNEWLFKVSDNGIGIDEKYRDKIFIIFQRLHKRNEYEGTGIGLAHCKKIVELHGGRIWVESTPDIGSNFTFTIPEINHI